MKQGQPLEGVYEFVSETLNLTKPRPVKKRIAPPEWEGLWFFQNGLFSQTMMKRGRGFLPYPSAHEALGYQSFAGSYVGEGNTIRLKRKLSLHPFNAGSIIVVRYQLDGQTLTLIETMHPYTEDLSEGERITVLRRVS